MVVIASFTRLRESAYRGASLLRFACTFALALPAAVAVSPSTNAVLCIEHAESLTLEPFSSCFVDTYLFYMKRDILPPTWNLRFVRGTTTENRLREPFYFTWCGMFPRYESALKGVVYALPWNEAAQGGSG